MPTVIFILQELYKSGAIDAEAVICVTGHSLGGALAVLAAHDIAAELKPYSMQVREPSFQIHGLIALRHRA